MNCSLTTVRVLGSRAEACAKIVGPLAKDAWQLDPAKNPTTKDRYGGAEAIRLAWWGADYTRGHDVTEVVQHQVASGCDVSANVALYGDPAPRTKKALLIWLQESVKAGHQERQEAVKEKQSARNNRRPCPQPCRW